MSKKYDDSFFDELDKTTDLLKAFKPHIDTNTKSSNNLDDLYNELNITQSKKTISNNQEKIVQSENKLKEEKKLEQERRIQQEKKKLEQKSIEDQKKKLIEVQKQKLIEEQRQKELIALRKSQAEKNEKELLQSKKQKQIQDLFGAKEDSNEKTDISEIVDKINESVKETKRKSKKKQKNIEKEKKDKAKFSPFEIIFCSLSFLFIIGCFAVYGSRLFKYYRVYNPKSEDGKSLTLLTTAIGKNSRLVYEGDGLYMSGGEYVYKGKDVDNYVQFSNLTWRIIKTNTDGTIDLVLDDYINSLPWANRPKAYLESDVHKYLNEYFIKYLDKDYLVPTIICKDEVNELKNFSCNNKNEENYVRLLSVNEFLNSKTEDTYISSENIALWLNTVSSDKTWQINGNSLSLADPTRALGIKPVVKLKSGVVLNSGDGTKNNPFIVSEKKDEIHVGSHVKLGNDIYVVYDMADDTLDLALSRLLPSKYNYSPTTVSYDITEKGSMAYYLNEILYKKMSYNSLIVEREWYTGKYSNSYEDITSTKISAKVGTLNMMDLKFDNDLQDYYLSNNDGTKVYVYGTETIKNVPKITQYIRPAIRIKKVSSTSGDGTRENPYVLGV